MRTKLKDTLLLVFLISGTYLLAQDSRGALTNGAAAVVNKKVVTVQDAFIFRALQRVKAGAQPIVFEEEGEELKKTVQKLVFEEMVLAEMKLLSKDSNIPSDAPKWFKESKEQKNGLEVIRKRYGVPESELLQKINRTSSADRFVQLKIETVTPVITEDETQKYFKRNEAQFRGRSYENIKPNIVIMLKKQAVQKSLEEWVKSLKEKYEVAMLMEN